MVLQKQAPSKHLLCLCIFWILIICSSTQDTDGPLTPQQLSKVKNDPNFWLKNTHYSSCQEQAVRTFVINTKEGDPVSLIIRQNVAGKVVVKGLQNGETSGHEVQVALNWTASDAGLLTAIHNDYIIKDGTDEKIVLIEVDLKDMKRKLEMSPIVVGSTVTGFFILLGGIILTLYLVRKRSRASQAEGESSMEAKPDNSETDKSEGNPTDDDEDSDYRERINDSDYRVTSHEEASLNLSVVPDSRVESSTLRSKIRNNGMDRRRSTVDTSGNNSDYAELNFSTNDDELIPPVPPQYLDDDSLPTDSSRETSFINSPATSKSSKPLYRSIPSSSGQTTPRSELLYEVPNKNRNRSQSTTAAKNTSDEMTATDEMTLTDGTESDVTQTGSINGRGTGSGRGTGGGGGGPLIGSSMLGRTVMIVACISVLTQAAFSFCHEDVTVEILIYIPKQAKINAIHLYSNEKKPSVFSKTDWYLLNHQKFQTFDLASAHPTTADPCDPKIVCPTAPSQASLGCDWDREKCVCKRGWEFDYKQECIDVDECGMGRCPPGMTCNNLPGSFDCTCLPGSFWNGVICQTCSHGCRAGLFQSQSCTSWSDRSCSPCTECKDGTFTYQPCNGVKDSLCMDVSEPYVQYDDAPSIDTAQVKLESQSNMFTEDLHNNRDQTNPLYISDNKQVINFQLSRDSGIRIYVKVDGFNLIPEYKDVDYEGNNDNLFVQSVLPYQKPGLNKITYNYCGSPIPAYYKLTMNKFRQRTTVLTDIVCNTTLNNCPSRFTDGQIYRFRTYNTKCPKTTIEVNRLPNAGNSLVCNEKTPLLSELFNDTLDKEKPYSFPSLECKQAMWNCKSCFNDYKCGDAGLNESCCSVKCHSQSTCKRAFSKECIDLPLECATGDTVQYIVQPEFLDLNKQFLCHIKRITPEYIFNVSYEIAIPTKDGWNSSRKSISLPTSGEFEATQSWDFLNVTYSNYLKNLQPDMLLNGIRPSGRNDFDEFQLFSFKPISEFNKTRPLIRKYETIGNRDTWNTDIQNERPFHINTWNFSSYGCYVDISKIHGNQTMYNASSALSVQLYMMKLGNKKFKYRIKDLSKIPKADFKVAGDQSVMKYYFPNSSLLISSVNVRLVDIDEMYYLYAIEITGSMSRCNSYLAVEIHDKTNKRRVALYDSFVYCLPSQPQPTFRYLVKLPGVAAQDKLFAVTLTDANTSLSYYVTTYSHATSLIQNHTIPIDMPEDSFAYQPRAFYAMIICFLMFCVIFLCIFVALSFGAIAIRHSNQNSHCNFVKRRRRALALAFMLYRLAYCVVFSFSILFLLIQASTLNEQTILSDLPTYHTEIRATIERNIRSITNFKRIELNRQYDMASQRVRACSEHSENSLETIKTFVDHRAEEIKEMRDNIEIKKLDLLMNRIKNYLSDLRAHIDKHEMKVRRQLEGVFDDYETVLVEVLNNGWLQLPRDNFRAMNTSNNTSQQKWMSNSLVQFLNYLGVDKPSSAVYQAQLLMRQLDGFHSLIKMSTNETIAEVLTENLSLLQLSNFLMRIEPQPVTYHVAEFSIGDETDMGYSGMKVLIWVVIIICDILLFLYRVSRTSHTLHRIKNGLSEEVPTPAVNRVEEIEINIIRKQIVGEGEMSKSLLEDQDEENDDHVSEVKQTSRTPSESGSRHAYSVQYGASDVESESFIPRSKYKRKTVSEGGSVKGSGYLRVNNDVEYYATLPATKPRPPRIAKQTSVASQNTNKSTQLQSAAQSNTPSVINEADPTPGNEDTTPATGSYFMSSQIARFLVNKNLSFAVFWLASQALAVIFIILVSQLVTYDTMIQLMNIDSMLTHIGMYASSVNNYLTTHAQAISTYVQENMVQEYNLHIHHIAKIRSLLQYDLNWALKDYSNKRCVLDNMLVEHCTYQPREFSNTLTPCQSFPIEPFQYTDDSALNTALISRKVAEFTDSLQSMIITSTGLIAFYINSIIIIHIISSVLQIILIKKRLLHVVKLHTTRLAVPVTDEIKSDTSRSTAQEGVRRHRVAHSRISSRIDLDSEIISEMSHHELRSQHSQSHDEEAASDPLLSKIRAQLSVTEQSDEATNQHRDISSLDQSAASESEL